MDYRKIGGTIYARLDKGDEVLPCILDISKKEKVLSAVYSGIGACEEVEVRTYIPAENRYRYDKRNGVLELISLTGNISADDNNNIFEHTHAIFSYLENGEIKFLGGHLTKAVVSYTAEIEIRPVQNGVIKRKRDDITGITVWDLK